MADSMKLPASMRCSIGTTDHSPFLARAAVMSALVVIALAGCSTMGRPGPSPSTPRGGGYYLDDGPGANPPADLDSIPDATPRVEPLNRGAMRPYVVMGKQYTPMTSLEPYRARGIASWYGRRYHGQRTSSGEVYDMYRMTAAHPILPIPSYARVTNLRNGRSVVVRINDRGPFLANREIDLSYVAAYKLGIVANGSGMVEVDSIIPGVAAPPVMASASEAPDHSAATAVDYKPGSAGPDSPPAASEPARKAPRATAIPQSPLTSDASGIYLQLGAFSSKQNAESFLARLQIEVASLANTMHIYSRDGLYRVHAGPYASRDEARTVADRIGQAFGIKSFVLIR